MTRPTDRELRQVSKLSVVESGDRDRLRRLLTILGFDDTLIALWWDKDEVYVRRAFSNHGGLSGALFAFTCEQLHIRPGAIQQRLNLDESQRPRRKGGTRAVKPPAPWRGLPSLCMDGHPKTGGLIVDLLRISSVAAKVTKSSLPEKHLLAKIGDGKVPVTLQLLRELIAAGQECGVERRLIDPLIEVVAHFPPGIKTADEVFAQVETTETTPEEGSPMTASETEFKTAFVQRGLGEVFAEIVQSDAGLQGWAQVKLEIHPSDLEEIAEGKSALTADELEAFLNELAREERSAVREANAENLAQLQEFLPTFRGSGSTETKSAAQGIPSLAPIDPEPLPEVPPAVVEGVAGVVDEVSAERLETALRREGEVEAHAAEAEVTEEVGDEAPEPSCPEPEPVLTPVPVAAQPPVAVSETPVTSQEGELFRGLNQRQVAAKIRQIAEQKELSMITVLASAGIAYRAQNSQVLNGRKTYSLKQLLAIARFLGMSFEELVAVTSSDAQTTVAAVPPVVAPETLVACPGGEAEQVIAEESEIFWAKDGSTVTVLGATYDLYDRSGASVRVKVWKRIDALRQSRQIDWRALAKAADHNYAVFSSLKAGATFIDERRIRRWAQALGVPEVELFNFSGKIEEIAPTAIPPMGEVEPRANEPGQEPEPDSISVVMQRSAATPETLVAGQGGEDVEKWREAVRVWKDEEGLPPAALQAIIEASLEGREPPWEEIYLMKVAARFAAVANQIATLLGGEGGDMIRDMTVGEFVAHFGKRA